jgi:SAM-dependent methyltransferase
MLAESLPGMVLVKNDKGFMFTELSPISRAYIHFSSECERVLEIGCAYGVSVGPVLKHSFAGITLVDLCADHIDYVMENFSHDFVDRIDPYVQSFPLETEFAENSFDAIHISNVLHFIRGEDIVVALQKCYRWLKPQGKIFISVTSVYCPIYSEFVSQYERLKAEGVRWAGEIEDDRYYMAKIFSADQLKSTPEGAFIHLFTKSDLVAEVRLAGFDIDSQYYFTLANVEVFKYADDTRSWIGVVAQKPL